WQTQTQAQTQAQTQLSTIPRRCTRPCPQLRGSPVLPLLLPPVPQPLPPPQLHCHHQQRQTSPQPQPQPQPQPHLHLHQRHKQTPPPPASTASRAQRSKPRSAPLCSGTTSARTRRSGGTSTTSATGARGSARLSARLPVACGTGTGGLGGRGSGLGAELCFWGRAGKTSDAWWITRLRGGQEGAGLVGAGGLDHVFVCGSSSGSATCRLGLQLGGAASCGLSRGKTLSLSLSVFSTHHIRIHAVLSSQFSWDVFRPVPVPVAGEETARAKPCGSQLL
ncbi:hypothetical protein DFP73DRAFT_629410, partial [Morchella snyderi]